jgi:hypothetical protein
MIEVLVAIVADLAPKGNDHAQLVRPAFFEDRPAFFEDRPAFLEALPELTRVQQRPLMIEPLAAIVADLEPKGNAHAQLVGPAFFLKETAFFEEGMAKAISVLTSVAQVPW